MNGYWPPFCFNIAQESLELLELELELELELQSWRLASRVGAHCRSVRPANR